MFWLLNISIGKIKDWNSYTRIIVKLHLSIKREKKKRMPFGHPFRIKL